MTARLAIAAAALTIALGVSWLWPRIQAAMLDEDSLVVTYNDWRGEPRGRHAKKAAAQGIVQGDCVDCNACVAVCPMGIDIRDGQQLECITCALCIDACDGVMDKIGKPRGLIDYMALSDEPLERAGKPPRNVWRHILRPRTLMYAGLWTMIGVALVFALLLDPKDGPVQKKQFGQVDKLFGEQMAKATLKLSADVASLDPRAKLPVADLAVGSLRRMAKVR